jgi:multiple sugar transport system substrate-binding protein
LPFRSWRLVFLLICLFLTSGCDDLRQRAIALWPFGPAATPTPATSPVSLLGWVGSEAENSQLQQAIAAFEQSSPRSPVAGRLIPDYSASLENELDSATPPDLFLAYSHQLADLVDDGLILPIPPNYSVTNQIAPNLVDGIQVDGRNYCFPRDVAILALFYNPAVFDRAQVGYPLNTWSWTEFRAAIDAAADINNGFYGLTLDYDLSRFLPFLLQSSSDDDLWQGNDALAAIEYYMDLYNDEVAAVPARLDSTWNGEAFGRGRAAMTIEGNWLVSYLANSFPSLNYGVTELPTGPSGRGTTAFITCWVVYANSANAAAALELASFLTSPDQVLAWANASGNLPPTLEQATAWVANHPTYAPFVAALSYATPWTGRAGFVEQAETVNLSMDMWYKDNMTTPELVGVLAGMSENPPLPTPTATPSEAPTD